MKKLIVGLTVCVFAITGKVSAQAGTGQGAGKPHFQDLHLISVLKEGQNSILIKEGKGTLQFTKNGDSFSNVSFKDSAGVVTRLVPSPAGTQGAPKPECKNPLPDACFGTADKNIGLCFCKPTDISAGYTISFLRKVRGNVKYQHISL